MSLLPRDTALMVFGMFIAGCAGLSGAMAADQEPAKPGQSAAGPALTNSQGMTLYTFDKDSGGKSACNGGCATSWPPLMAGADAQPVGKYTVIGRDDGTKQWAYKGKPLYSWSKDGKPGDSTGNGFNGLWHVAKP